MNILGLRYRLRSLVGERFKLAASDAACSLCGGKEFLQTRPVVMPDFAAGSLPEPIRGKMLFPTDGLCVQCGLYQRLDRLTEAELALYLQLIASKDSTASEEAYHTYPVPIEYITMFEEKHFNHRMQRWADYLDEADIRPKSALILRPTFGAAAGLMHRLGASRIDAMEISRVGRLVTEERFPFVRFPEGNIHGILQGEFLNAEPYDVVIVYHVLQHVFGVADSLRKIRRLVNENGVVIFMHEIDRKPHNPFHQNHFSEVQLTNAVATVFGRVSKISNCDVSPPSNVTNNTLDGDSPDIVAFCR
jgi:SAM-dependent methyltransferase